MNNANNIILTGSFSFPSEEKLLSVSLWCNMLMIDDVCTPTCHLWASLANVCDGIKTRAQTFVQLCWSTILHKKKDSATEKKGEKEKN